MENKKNRSRISNGYLMPELFKPDELLAVLIKSSPEEQKALIRPLRELEKARDEALKIKQLLDIPLAYLQFIKMKPVNGATVLSLMALMDDASTSKAREFERRVVSNRQCKKARKDRKKKPSKNELLAFIDKWEAAEGSTHGSIKGASREFCLSDTTIRKILKD